MKLYPHIINEFLRTAWAITPERLSMMADILRNHAAGVDISADAWKEMRAAYEAKEASARAMSGAGVQVLPVFGVISHRMNIMGEMSGGVSTEKFAKAFRSAMADPEVGTIVLDIESPGGSVFGVAELAEEIFQARGQKKVIAAADAYAASAAYWIGAAAEEFVVTPSGQVGSIGVYAVHEDYSKFLEMAGIKPTFISAGKFKVEGNEAEPLSEDARAALQKEVNAYYGMFVKAVAKGRGVKGADVRNGFGEGRMVTAAEAVELGMADRVATLDDVVRSANRGGSRARAEEKPEAWAMEIEQEEQRLRMMEAE